MTKVLSTWRCHLTVLLPLLLALVLRASYLATFFQTPGYRVPVVDAGYHDAWARGMAFDAWDFSEQHDVAAMRNAPYFRPPGYVYFLSAIYRVFGTDPLWPRVGNLVLGLLAVLLLGAFAERAYGSRVAWLVRLLAGGYWGLIYFEGELLEVPLLVFAATACLYGLIRAESAGRGAATPIDDHRPQSTPGGATPSTLLTGVDGGCRAASAACARAPGTPVARRACVWALAAGVALGVHAIARPNILLVAPVLAAWLGWRVWRNGRRGRSGEEGRDNPHRPPSTTVDDRRCRRLDGGRRSSTGVDRGWSPFFAMAALTLGALLVILPVTIRNRLVGGEWVLISTNGGINLYIGNNDQAEGLFVGRTAEFNHFGDSGVYEKILADLADEKGRRPSYREADRYFAEKAVDWMRQHPWRTVVLMGRKLVYLTSAWETGHNRVIYWERRKLPVLRWLPGNWGVLLALCAAAGVLGRRRLGGDASPYHTPPCGKVGRTVPVSRSTETLNAETLNAERLTLNAEGCPAEVGRTVPVSRSTETLNAERLTLNAEGCPAEVGRTVPVSRSAETLNAERLTLNAEGCPAEVGRTVPVSRSAETLNAERLTPNAEGCPAEVGRTVPVSRSQSASASLLVVLFAVVYALSFLPFFVTGQYRMPLVPWLCLGAAVGIDRMIQAARDGAWRRVVLALAAAGLAYTGAAVNWLDFKPNLTKWYFDEALSCESIGQVDQAVAMYREATRSNGDTRRSWYNLGLLESARRRPQAAIEAFRSAIRAGMKGGRVWNDLGVVLLRSGRATEARDALAEAVRLRPDRADWRHNYAAALMASGGGDNQPPSTPVDPRRR